MDVHRHLEVVLPVLIFKNLAFAPRVLPKICVLCHSCSEQTVFPWTVLSGLSVRFYRTVLCDVMNLIIIIIIIIINSLYNVLIQCGLLCLLRTGDTIFMGHIIFVGTKISKMVHLFLPSTDENIQLHKLGE